MKEISFCDTSGCKPATILSKKLFTFPCLIVGEEGAGVGGWWLVFELKFLEKSHCFNYLLYHNDLKIYPRPNLQTIIPNYQLFHPPPFL